MLITRCFLVRHGREKYHRKKRRVDWHVMTNIDEKRKIKRKNEISPKTQYAGRADRDAISRITRAKNIRKNIFKTRRKTVTDTSLQSSLRHSKLPLKRFGCKIKGKLAFFKAAGKIFYDFKGTIA